VLQVERALLSQPLRGRARALPSFTSDMVLIVFSGNFVAPFFEKNNTSHAFKNICLKFKTNSFK
jgi:hypothetical protein